MIEYVVFALYTCRWDGCKYVGGKEGDTRGLNALVSSIEASSKPPASTDFLIIKSLSSPELYVFSTFTYLALPT